MYRKIAHVVGIALFIVLTIYAVRSQPISPQQIDPHLLIVSCLLAAASVVFQSGVVYVLLPALSLGERSLVAVWLTAEKAWLNSVAPAKAGTIASSAILVRRYGISISSNVRLLVANGAITLCLSCLGALFLLVQPTLAALMAIPILGMLLVAAWYVSGAEIGHIALIAGCASVNMVLLTLGVAGCVVGLGHDIGAADVLKTGATLNALSVVSITPGNFGIRELVLASLRSAVDIDVALILQGSSAYVLLRLVVSLAIATALRSKVIS